MVKMATFNNASCSTFSNGAVESNSSSGVSSNKSGSKRLSGWVKFKRHFCSKPPATDKGSKTAVPPGAAPVSAVAAGTTIPAASEGGLPADDQFMKSDTFYHNRTAGSVLRDDPDDRVFVDATLPPLHKTVPRRRHSLGSWIRTSFSAVKRPATPSRGSAAVEKPLLAGVSSTPSTITFRRGDSGKADNQTPKAESRVQVSEEGAGEPRQALETLLQLRSRGTLSQERRMASLDRRYTKSAEMTESSRAEQAFRSRSNAELQRLVEDDKVKQAGRKSLKVNHSRTIQERLHGKPCCSRSQGNRQELRRASADSVRGALRRRWEKCRLKDQPDMENTDVAIVYSKNCIVSVEWMHYFCNYIKTVFAADQRSGVKVTPMDVENLVSGGNLCHDYTNQSVVDQEEQNRAETRQLWRTSFTMANLQMVLVSRSLLDHVIKHADDPLGMLLDPELVVALLLDVDEARDINEYHRAALFSYPHWTRVKMEDLDYKCVSQVLRHAYRILSKSKSLENPRPLTTPSRFKLCPRKLGPGETKATKVSLESGSLDKPVEILLSCKDVKSVPAQNVAWVNPHVLSFRIPERIGASGDFVEVEMRTDAISWGICELKRANPAEDLSSLSNLIQNPLAIMCDLLNFSPTDHSSLDRALEESLQKNFPPRKFTFFKVGTMEFESSIAEIPTVLHFASRYGFQRFTRALLDCPGSAEAVTLKNIHEMDCIQIAEKHGHASLAAYLREFLVQTLPEYEYPTCIDSQLKMPFCLVPPPSRPVDSLNKDFVIAEECAVLMQPSRPPCRPPRCGIEILEEEGEPLGGRNLRTICYNPYILPDEEADWMENHPLPPRPRRSSPRREYVNFSGKNRVFMDRSIQFEQDSPSSLYMRMESPRNLFGNSFSKSKWTHQCGDHVSMDEEVYITASSPHVPEPVLENPGPKVMNKPALPRRRKVGLIQQTAVSADDIVLQSQGSSPIPEQRSLDPANNFSASEPNLSVQKLQVPDDRRPVPRNPKFSPTHEPGKLFPTTDRPLPLIPEAKD